MSNFSNPDYLKSEQYRSAANLEARTRLHERFSSNSYPWYQWLFDQIDIPSTSHILELGCGRGDFWFLNRKRIPSGWQVMLTDLSSGMLNATQAHLGEDSKRYSYLEVDAQTIPFEDNMFDAVFANSMLYHVPDRPTALGEISRVLKPGGQLYAATVGEKHMQELHQSIYRFAPEMVIWGQDTDRTFSLENGASQIKPFFAEVTLHRRPDGLIVTEPQPFVDYVLSIGDTSKVLVGKQLDEFIAFVQREIDVSGAIHITKELGLFVARAF